MSEIAEVDRDRVVGVRPEEYESFTKPIPAGVYKAFKTTGVRRNGITKDGDPWATVAVTVMDGEHAGAAIECFVSTRRERQRNGTAADDLLMTVGFTPYPTTLQEYEDALAACEGEVAVRNDWEAKCFNREAHADGEIKTFSASEFPFDENGERSCEKTCPECGEVIVARNKGRIIPPRRK